MSRFWGLALLLAGLLGPSGCGQKAETASPSQQPSAPAARAADSAAYDETNPVAPTPDAIADAPKKNPDEAAADTKAEEPPKGPRPSLLLSIMIKPLTVAAQANAEALQSAAQPLMGAAGSLGVGPKKPATPEAGAAADGAAAEAKPEAKEPAAEDKPAAEGTAPEAEPKP